MPFDKRIIESEALGSDNDITVFVPDVERERFATVYLYHGLGDDNTTPWERTGLYGLAEEHELIIVTADAGRGWFCNDGRGERAVRWEDYFAFELPAYIEENYPAAPAGSARGLCGFSMGGYGAMMLAMRHPGRFAAVSAHSGSFSFGHEYRADRPERTAFMKAVAPPGGDYDLFRLAGELGAGAVPSIRFDIGRGDHLLDHNRSFHARLDECGIEHRYTENGGEHSWSYVGEHLHDSLDFFTAELTF